MNARAEIAELVMDHLGRASGMVPLAAVISGLAALMTAYDDAQERRGTWSTMLANLRSGVATIESALPVLRSQGDPGVATVIQLAERELPFARLLEDEMVRLQAGESTNV